MTMKVKNVLFSLIIIFSVLFSFGCTNNRENINANDDTNIKKIYNDLTIIINDIQYELNLENNNTTKELLNLLPLDIQMIELNGNEKYYYLEDTLPVNSYNPKKITAGDVMLYGNNCIVIFYKSFDTSYSYTKIGHIDNLPDLGNSNISVKISK